jgi:hypothetical protein
MLLTACVVCCLYFFVVLIESYLNHNKNKKMNVSGKSCPLVTFVDIKTSFFWKLSRYELTLHRVEKVV